MRYGGVLAIGLLITVAAGCGSDDGSDNASNGSIGAIDDEPETANSDSTLAGDGAPDEAGQREVPTEADCLDLLPLESVEQLTGLSVTFSFVNYNNGEAEPRYPVECQYLSGDGEVRLLWNWHFRPGDDECTVAGGGGDLSGIGRIACTMSMPDDDNAGIVFAVEDGTSGTLTAYLPDAADPSAVAVELARLAAEKMSAR